MNSRSCALGRTAAIFKSNNSSCESYMDKIGWYGNLHVVVCTQFKKTFNETDKGFLKKMHSLHSNLTPNDLKLCVYLRLNLSSKEIAPLSNISVRSVEIKRYRLRKKMGLEHEKSLVEYILEV